MGDSLLGAGHREIVERLLERLERVADPDCQEPRVIVLRGASGVGKTRIVQELYERLRQERGDAYWPPLAPVTRQHLGAGADPMPGRKLVAPPLTGFVWPEDALPTFGWWGFNCERLSTGNEMDVVQAVVPQLGAHTIPVEIARFRSLGGGRRTYELAASAWRAVRADLVEEGGDAALDLLAGLVGVTVPFVGVLARWGVKGFGGAKQAWDRRADLGGLINVGERVEEQRRSAAEDLADVLSAMTAKEVPAVLVVEDAHLMGGDLAELLNQLAARRSAPVLVVATAWPETRTGSVYERWYESASAEGRVERLEVPALGAGDLVSILREHAPKTDDATAQAIVGRLANPHLLKLWLTMKVTRRRIEGGGGALVLREGDLEDLPRDLKEVIARRWDELDEEVREALTWAVAANPDADDAVCRFPPREVAQAVAQWRHADRQDTRRAFAHAVDPDSWCLLEEESELFTEILLAEHVRELSPELVGEDEAEDLRECVRRALAARLSSFFTKLDLPSGRGSSLLASWYLTLTGARVGANTDSSEEDTWRPAEEDDVEALAVALWHAANEAAQRYRYDQAVRFAARVLTCLQACALDAGDPRGRMVRDHNARWVLDAGDPARAAGLYSELLEDCMRLLGADHPDTLATRGNLASAALAAGDPGRAAGMFSELLKDQLRLLGPEHPDTLATRGNLASAVRDAGDPGRAAGMYSELLEDCMRVLGADHPGTLATRGNLASAVLAAGDPGRAAGMFSELLKDMARVLGPEHPHTLTTRGNLASAVRDAGDPGRAAGMYSELLKDHTRLLGADHPGTLTTRNSLASAALAAGDPGRAAGMYSELLKDMARVLGPEHPGTLTTRANLASAVRAAGDPEKAADGMRALLADLLARPEPHKALIAQVRQVLASWGEDV
ncbi:tetratricopeptide repeat protein [Actinomyces sp. W5033]|uniref:tetratricopeptide repeat protein n=1 Tax=Actinomyces sp. W5033 TaxID=3446479 RepID=UPI003EDFACAB